LTYQAAGSITLGVPDVTCNTSTVGTRIRSERLERGLRVEDLASASNVAGRTITRVEAGYDAQLSTLRRIANGLGMSLVDLLVDDQPQDAA
jgi:transcriptional regulator with XRE-family HTH domain